MNDRTDVRVVDPKAESRSGHDEVDPTRRAICSPYALQDGSPVKCTAVPGDYGDPGVTRGTQGVEPLLGTFGFGHIENRGPRAMDQGFDYALGTLHRVFG